MLNIGVDLDGVCYDFGESLRQYLVHHEGFSLDVLHYPKVWNFFLDWGMTTEEYLEAYARGVDAGYVLRQGAPHDGCIKTLEMLKADGHQLNIVTYRTVGSKAIENTMAWLQEYSIPYDTICFSKDKTVVKNDVFIEDNVENFEALESAGIRSFLMDRPWNTQKQTGFRVWDWSDFYSYLQLCLRVGEIQEHG